VALETRGHFSIREAQRRSGIPYLSASQRSLIPRFFRVKSNSLVTDEAEKLGGARLLGLCAYARRTSRYSFYCYMLRCIEARLYDITISLKACIALQRNNNPGLYLCGSNTKSLYPSPLDRPSYCLPQHVPRLLRPWRKTEFPAYIILLAKSSDVFNMSRLERRRWSLATGRQ
jgi:hypothetical protein